MLPARPSWIFIVLSASPLVGCASATPPTAQTWVRKPATAAPPADDRDLEEARQLHEQSRRLREQLSSAGAADRVVGARKGLPAITRALEIRKAKLHDTHPDTEESLLLHSWFLAADGRYDEAIPEASLVLAAREKRLGPAHLLVAEVLDAVASGHRYSNRFADAISFAERALKIRETAQGKSHPEYLLRLLTLASMCTDACRLEEAQAHLGNAVALVEARDGSLSAELIEILEHWARVLLQQGKMTEYASALERAAALTPTTKKHAEIAQKVLEELAVHRERNGDLKSAIALRERALAHASWNADSLLPAAQSLAETYAADHQDAKVEQLFQQHHWVQYGFPMKPGAKTAQMRPGTGRTADVAPKTARDGLRCTPMRYGQRNAAVTDARAVVAAMRPHFKDCYDKALSANPQVEARLRINSRIGPQGEVLFANTVVPDTVPEPLVQCVLTVVVKSRFSPPEGGSATMVIPLTLVVSTGSR